MISENTMSTKQGEGVILNRNLENRIDVFETKTTKVNLKKFQQGIERDN